LQLRGFPLRKQVAVLLLYHGFILFNDRDFAFIVVCEPGGKKWKKVEALEKEEEV